MKFLMSTKGITLSAVIISLLFHVFKTTQARLDPEFGYKYEIMHPINAKNLVWDSSKEPWLRLYVRLCGYVCNGTQLIRVRYDYKQNVPFCPEACMKCDCDYTCPIYGTCCPRIDPATPLHKKDVEYAAFIHFFGNLSSLNFTDANDFVKFSRDNQNMALDERMMGNFQCMSVRYGSTITSMVYAIAECPEVETNETLRQMCTSDDIDSSTVKSVLPYSDSRNGIVYKNIYCLECWERTQHSNRDLLLPLEEKGEGSSVRYDVDVFYKWNMTVECFMYQGLYKLVAMNSFLVAVLKSTKRGEHPHGFNPFCILEYTNAGLVSKLTSYSDKECYSNTGSVQQQPQCNNTGNLDPFVAELCTTIKEEAYTIFPWPNLFCFLCNGQNTLLCDIMQPSILEYDTSVTTPINFLLGYQPSIIRESVETTRVYQTYLCPKPLEWMDDKGNCRLPVCTDGKLLDRATGQCHTAISVIKNLGYKLAMVFVPDQPIAREHAWLIHESIQLFIYQFMESHYLALYMIINGWEDTDDNDIIEHVKLQGNFVARSEIKRDPFERSFLDHKFQIKLDPLDQNSSVNLILAGMGVDHVGRMGIREHTQGNPEDLYKLPDTRNGAMSDQPRGPVDGVSYTTPDWLANKQRIKRMASTTMPNWQANLQPIQRINKSDTPSWRGSIKPIKRMTTTAEPNSRGSQWIIKSVDYEELEMMHQSHMIWKMKEEFIDMNPTLFCPFVIVNIKDVSYINETIILITFYYRGEEKSINTTWNGRNLNIEGNLLKICIDTFREEFQKVFITEPISNNTDVQITLMSQVKRNLTIGCLILSIICLLITAFTYCIFTQLRTLPGLNTLSLCLSLASAQFTLIMVVELIGHVHGYVCVALGILLHYTWLCSFCWMGVSCIHMYLVFKGTSIRVGAGDPAKRHTKYRICAFGTSAVIVSLHICVSEIASEGKTTGYSDQLCFFDTDWSILTVILSFVTPLAIVMTINTVLFGITVREMVLIRRLQAVRRVKSRGEVLTYVKLSTITGVQWLVTIGAVRTGSDVADISVALLVGLQGVFIFASFTLNAKTRNLYKNLFRRDGTSASIRKSSQTSHTHVLSTQSSGV